MICPWARLRVLLPAVWAEKTRCLGRRGAAAHYKGSRKTYHPSNLVWNQKGHRWKLHPQLEARSSHTNSYLGRRWCWLWRWLDLWFLLPARARQRDSAILAKNSPLDWTWGSTRCPSPANSSCHCQSGCPTTDHCHADQTTNRCPLCALLFWIHSN